MSVRICTIIARNYLPAARVLATSFLEHNPGGRAAVLVIDDVYAEVDPLREPFEVLRPRDIGLEPDEFDRMAMIYDVTELASSLKPWLLTHLLVRDPAQPLVYLDADIRVYAPLDEVSALGRKYGIVLTPHVTRPMPRDGKNADETAILAAGIYNLGFLAVGPQSQPFLDYWMERLSRDGLVDVSNMRAADQRWVDFVPGMFDCHILRDVSYNVAYWNVFQRDFHMTGADYRVDGLPLKFFHFSGFDQTAPSLLSRYQVPRPRVLLSESPSIARICSEYVDALRSHTRRGETDVTYAFAELPNSVPLDLTVRRLYREWLIDSEAKGNSLPPSPFSLEGADEFVAWATAAPHTGESLSGYLAAVHRSRLDLQVALPHLENQHQVDDLASADPETSIGCRHTSRLPLAVPLREGPVIGVHGTAPAARDGGLSPDALTLLNLARSRADVNCPSRHPWLSRLPRRVMARLTAHNDAHRAAVDVRLAEAVTGLAASVRGLERRTHVVAATEAAIRVSALDVRVRQVSEMLSRRIDSAVQRYDRVAIAQTDPNGDAAALQDSLLVQIEALSARIDSLEGGPAVLRLATKEPTTADRGAGMMEAGDSLPHDGPTQIGTAHWLPTTQVVPAVSHD